MDWGPPFLLHGTIKKYLTTSKQCYPESAAHIKEIEESLYVHDLITSDATIEEIQKVKETAIRVFGDPKFKLHKWHLNVKELDDFTSTTKPDISFEKQELRTETSEPKILAVSWNKVKDTFEVNFQVPDQPAAKREMLKLLASIYNLVRIILPVTLLAKDMYRDAGDLKLSWDQRLPEDLMKQWTKWIKGLPHQQVEVPRSIPIYNEKMPSVTLHAFADAISKEVCAAVYAVVDQLKGKSQGLLTSKTRLAKKILTIPRLELIATHMDTNLLSNIKKALRKYPIRNS